MDANSFDLIVIGGGSAGYAAARTAAGLGLKTGVIDGSRELGGLCILRGCMPSKALIESANRFVTLRRAEEFGLRASGLEVKREEIWQRKVKLIAEFADYRREQLEKGKFELLRGTARFLSPHRLAVSLLDGGEREVEARTFVIATGSVNAVPDVPGLAGSGFLTSDDVLDAREMPDNLVVLGGGPIALELAYFHQALGVPTTVIQRSGHVLTGQDAEMAREVETGLRAGGLTLFTGTRIMAVGRDADKTTVCFEHNGAEKVARGTALLCALGRRPAVDGLDLESAGVESDRRGVRVGDTQQSSAPHVFAAGDVCGPHEVVHLAITQGETAARNAAALLAGKPAEEMARMDYRLKLFAMFTHPEFASVGFTPEEARAAGHDVAVASHPFADHGKSMVMGETHGCVQLTADRRTGELLGGAVVGPAASDLIHEIVVAMHFRSSATDLAAVPHYHPTLSEIWTYPAEELAESCGPASA